MNFALNWLDLACGFCLLAFAWVACFGFGEWLGLAW